MSELLFEADERTLENLMEGPWVTIEARPQSTGAKRMALFNKAGFARYAHLVDDYGCDGFAVEIEDITENRLQAYFAPDLDRIANKDGIVEIGLTGSGAFARDFDLDGFKRFANVRRITTGHVSFAARLPELFPGLETWQNLDWKANPVKGLEGRWQGLANLSLQGFSGSLAVFDGLPVRNLFLIAATIKDIADILRFEDLDVLQIVSCRIAGDVSALSRLKKLHSLRFEGKNKLEGWERLGSDGIVNFEASHYPCRFPREKFAKFANYAINVYRARDPFYEEGGDAAALAREFSAI